jgi:8-oxo-dGTP diphosphatase
MKNGNYEEGRYVVLLFKATEYTGDVVSSAEGLMEWIDYSQISEIDTVDDFQDLLDVFNNPSLTEFQYLVEGDNWKVSKR